MIFVARILEDLGYEKIVMILDGDDHALKIRDSLVAEFPNYQTYKLPVADIRDKEKFEKIEGWYLRKERHFRIM